MKDRESPEEIVDIEAEIYQALIDDAELHITVSEKINRRTERV